MTKFFDAYGPNSTTVRMFILERGGITLDVQSIDILTLENRGLEYRRTVNSRGELPALQLDDGSVITEITAICEYLDEAAHGGESLIGATAKERAETRMWTRRVYLEICQHFVSWWRNGEDAADFYRGHRVQNPDARSFDKLAANQGLNRLDDELEGKTFLCGDRISLGDIVLFGFMSVMLPQIPWLNPSGRGHVASWFARMSERPNVVRASALLPAGHFSN